MDRKLASIQKIVSLDPIPDADKILKATVLGWECVVAKADNFKVGDLVCYIEIDSLVPEKPEFEFLRDKKFRVRTIRLRNQVSQGLVIPLSLLPKSEFKYKEGDDVTEILGVKKYDPEAELEQKLIQEKADKSKNKVEKFLMRYPWYQRLFKMFLPKKAGWPTFIKKTNEDRIQLFPWICERESNTPFIITEKLDGQSGSFFLIKNTKRFLLFGEKYIFGVCSRNLHLPKEDNSSYWNIARKLNMKKRLLNLIGKNDFVAVQGEIVGKNIQGNKYKVEDFDFYAFNLIYPDGKVDSIEASLSLGFEGIKFVPILARNFKLLPSVSEMVEYAKGESKIAPGVKREGIVVRNNEKNISFKVINPDFLLKYDD